MKILGMTLLEFLLFVPPIIGALLTAFQLITHRNALAAPSFKSLPLSKIVLLGLAGATALSVFLPWGKCKVVIQGAWGTSYDYVDVSLWDFGSMLPRLATPNAVVVDQSLSNNLVLFGLVIPLVILIIGALLSSSNPVGEKITRYGSVCVLCTTAAWYSLAASLNNASDYSHPDTITPTVFCFLAALLAVATFCVTYFQQKDVKQ